jgi:hypothetical protein
MRKSVKKNNFKWKWFLIVFFLLIFCFSFIFISDIFELKDSISGAVFGELDFLKSTVEESISEDSIIVEENKYSINNVKSLEPCVCPDSDADWEINMSDNCVIEEVCDIGEGKLSFVGEGNVTINSTVTISDLGNPSSNSTIYVGANAVIKVQ